MSFAPGVIQVTELVSERSVFHLLLKVNLVWSVKQRITGEKWTLPILRELFDPERFSF